MSQSLKRKTGDSTGPSGIGPKRRAELESVMKIAKKYEAMCYNGIKDVRDTEKAVCSSMYKWEHIRNRCEVMLAGYVPYHKMDLGHARKSVPHWTMDGFDAAKCSRCGHKIAVGFRTKEEADRRWHEVRNGYRFCPHCGVPMMDMGDKDK